MVFVTEWDINDPPPLTSGVETYVYELEDLAGVAPADQEKNRKHFCRCDENDLTENPPLIFCQVKKVEWDSDGHLVRVEDHTDSQNIVLLWDINDFHYDPSLFPEAGPGDFFGVRIFLHRIGMCDTPPDCEGSSSKEDPTVIDCPGRPLRPEMDPDGHTVKIKGCPEEANEGVLTMWDINDLHYEAPAVPPVYGVIMPLVIRRIVTDPDPPPDCLSQDVIPEPYKRAKFSLDPSGHLVKLDTEDLDCLCGFRCCYIPDIYDTPLRAQLIISTDCPTMCGKLTDPFTIEWDLDHVASAPLNFLCEPNEEWEGDSETLTCPTDGGGDVEIFFKVILNCGQGICSEGDCNGYEATLQFFDASGVPPFSECKIQYQDCPWVDGIHDCCCDPFILEYPGENGDGTTDIQPDCGFVDCDFQIISFTIFRP